MSLDRAGSGARWLSAALICSLVFYGSTPLTATQAESAPKLNIVILEGEGAINNIRQRTAREPIVQVEDENHKPVAGAVVVFALPDRGASGVFANGSHTLTVTTDAQGRAAATGLRPNNVQGNYQIHVTASHQGQTASATINQSNALATGAAAGGISGKTIAILLGIAGGAAAGGVVAATRGNKTGPSPQAGPAATVVTAGTPTISPPPR
jgi:hypothetical protein